MRALILLVTAVLAGCSTSELADKDPVFAGETSKTPGQFSKCLAPKWQEFNPSTSVVETETGIRILASNTFSGAIAMAVVEQRSTGSQITVHLQNGWSPGTGGWIDSARSCI